jgi:hypothetical protein
MFINIFRENIGNILVLLFPFEDGTIEVVFVEMAGENIDRLVLFQERIYNIIWIQPIIEYQDGFLCFQHKATMKDVCESHCFT